MAMHMMKNNQTILVTGGSGFIGSHFIRYVLSETSHRIVNVDALTYAGSAANLRDVDDNPHYHFEHHSICDYAQMLRIFEVYQPDKVIHLAAESHVDRSISSAAQFLDTNVMGTYTLLESCRSYWEGLDDARKDQFKFHHVSTDEVYGDLEDGDEAFRETSRYNPSSPYSASKAASDHLVRAWMRTYGLPSIISNCSNNYGPYQFPEKLIPVVIQNALKGNAIPVYGHGEQIRDWLHVDDHVRALLMILMQGEAGETYNVGGSNEMRNIDLVRMVCDVLNVLRPAEHDYKSLIQFVDDRPGHDLRYAVNCDKLQRDFGWKPQVDFEKGLQDTVQWYLDHQSWCAEILAQMPVKDEGRAA